jgi:hypothetical protein
MRRFQYTMNPPGGQGPRSGPRQYTDLLADVRTRAGPLRATGGLRPSCQRTDHRVSKPQGSKALQDTRSPKPAASPSDGFKYRRAGVGTAARVRRTHGQAGKRRGDGSQRRRRPPTDAKPALPSERDHRSMLHGQRVHVYGGLSPPPRRLPATSATVIRAEAIQLFRTVCTQRTPAARAHLLRIDVCERASLGWCGCQPTSGGSRRRESTAQPGEAVSGAFPPRSPQPGLRRQAAPQARRCVN